MSGEDLLKPRDTKAAKALIKREIKTEVKTEEVKTEEVKTEEVKPEKKSRRRKKAASSTTGSDSGLATSPPSQQSQPSPEYMPTNMSDYQKDSPRAVSKKSFVVLKAI